MIIAIYSARVLLQTLGVNNYGLYNLVGGVVSIFSSMKGIFAASVQRFLNYEKGKANVEKENEIFNMSIYIHLGISLFFLIIVEILGLWYIYNKMVLPAGALGDALFVFHCSVLAFSVSIITVPYDAVVIANEKMKFYAWVSIAESVLKLAAIFLLLYLPYNKIRVYALLILVIAVAMRYVSVVYTKKFPECKRKRVWNKKTVKELTTFAGWNFFGCMAFSLVEEGANLILNIFGGVAVNAVRAIAYQVKSAVSQLSTNVVTASQPLLFQEAATASKETFWSHAFIQTKAVYYFVIITTTPIFVYAPQLLSLWLDEVPDNSISFVRVVLIYLLIMTFQKPLDIGFKAYNKMVKYQIIDSSVILLSLPAIYLVLNWGLPLYWAFIVLSIVRLIDYAILFILAEKTIGLNIKNFFLQVFSSICYSTILSVAVGYFFYKWLNYPQWYTILILVVIMVFILLVLFYLFTFSKKEKDLISKIVFSKIFKSKK